MMPKNVTRCLQNSFVQSAVKFPVDYIQFLSISIPRCFKPRNTFMITSIQACSKSASELFGTGDAHGYDGHSLGDNVVGEWHHNLGSFGVCTLHVGRSLLHVLTHSRGHFLIHLLKMRALKVSNWILCAAAVSATLGTSHLYLCIAPHLRLQELFLRQPYQPSELLQPPALNKVDDRSDVGGGAPSKFTTIHQLRHHSGTAPSHCRQR